MGAPHWHVLGAGAIGCLFATALHSRGYPTTLIVRPGGGGDSLPVVIERGNVRSEYHLLTVPPEQAGAISHLLVTTKAHDVRDAVASVAQLVTGKGVVVILANGMGFAEQVSADWPDLDIVCGTTTEGAYRVGPQHIRHAGHGQTRIGRAGTREHPDWFGHFAGAVDSCVWDLDIESSLWSKLAVNCVINPLSALHGCLNGQLAEREDIAAEVATLCDEVARICRAEGRLEIAATLPDTVADVIANTANNRSSMLQDVQQGRRTEIDYINGYLLQVADRHGVDAPLNRALVERFRRHGD